MKSVIAVSVIALLTCNAFAGTTQVGSAGVTTIEKQFLFGAHATQVDLNLGDVVPDSNYIGRKMYPVSVVCSDAKFNNTNKSFHSLAPGETFPAGNIYNLSAVFTCSKKKVKTGLIVHFGCVEESEKTSRYYTHRATIPENYAQEIESRGDMYKEYGIPEATIVASKACAEFGGGLNEARPWMIRGKMLPKNQ